MSIEYLYKHFSNKTSYFNYSDIYCYFNLSRVIAIGLKQAANHIRQVTIKCELYMY